MGTKKILCCLLVCLLLPACEDIFLKDISEEEVVVLSPLDRALFEGETILFMWDRMEGAERYLLEVASPSFSRDTLRYSAVADTNRVELSLPGGQYQWSVYGYNSGYKSKKIIRSFEIKEDEE